MSKTFPHLDRTDEDPYAPIRWRARYERSLAIKDLWRRIVRASRRSETSQF